MDKRKEIDALISRYQNGTCTPEEQALIEQILFTEPHNQAEGVDTASYQEALWAKIYPTLRGKKTPSLKRWYYAAAAILLIGLFTYLFFNSQVNRQTDQHTLMAEVVPGTTKAILTLADGEAIQLDGTHTGIIINDNEIVYNNGNKLLELAGDNTDEKRSRSQLAILHTPKGGTYQISLPDGTKVWLNAASTLTYPMQFSGSKREVELDGEAYFDIAKNPSKPFIVKSRMQETTVLGTAFNIAAYKDDEMITTTVVNGSVRVRATTEPTTGYPSQMGEELLALEQSIITSSGVLTKQKVTDESAVAWKTGSFYFNGTTLAEMLKQIARWYDIEIVYLNNIPAETFSGKLERNASLVNILEFLKGAGIKCRMENRKLLIE